MHVIDYYESSWPAHFLRFQGFYLVVVVSPSYICSVHIFHCQGVDFPAGLMVYLRCEDLEFFEALEIFDLVLEKEWFFPEEFKEPDHPRFSRALLHTERRMDLQVFELDPACHVLFAPHKCVGLASDWPKDFMQIEFRQVGSSVSNHMRDATVLADEGLGA